MPKKRTDNSNPFTENHAESVCKKSLAILFSALLAFTATGCGSKKQENMGSLKTTKSATAETGTVSSDKPFHGIKNDTEYSYKLHKSGYGKIAVPYPSSWKLHVISARQIRITDSKTQTTVYIDFMPLMDGESVSTQQFVSMFKPTLNAETFTIDDVKYYRYITQDYSQPASSFEENNSKTAMIGYDISNLAGEEANVKSPYDHVGSERRYYFKSEGVAGCISLITKQSEFEKMKKVIDYMASNVQPYTEKYAKGRTVPADGLNVKLASCFSSSSAAQMGKGMHGTIYKCPMNSESGCAGAFVTIAQTNRKLTKERADPTSLFTQVYPVLENQLGKNDYATIYKMTNDTGYGSVYKAAKEAADAKDVKLSDGYSSVLSLTDVDSGSIRGMLFQSGDSWSFEAFQIGSGKDQKTVFVGYPSTQESAVKDAISFS